MHKNPLPLYEQWPYRGSWDINKSVAVVIPAYNRCEQLSKALQSLADQTYKNFYTVIVDDASEDNIREVAERFMNTLNIVYMRQETNQGPGAARHRALQWCYDNEIEYLIFLDSDDLFKSNAIETTYKKIQSSGADLVTFLIEGSTPTTKLKIWPYSLSKWWTPGKMYRISFLKKIELNFPLIRYNEDYAFNLVAVSAAEQLGRVVHLDECLYTYNSDPTGMTKIGTPQEKTIWCSRTLILAANFAVHHFNRLGIDIFPIFHLILRCYEDCEILRAIKALDVEIEEALYSIFHDETIQLLLKDELSQKTNYYTRHLPSRNCFGAEYKFEWNYQKWFKHYANIEV